MYLQFKNICITVDIFGQKDFFHLKNRIYNIEKQKTNENKPKEVLIYKELNNESS